MRLRVLALAIGIAAIGSTSQAQYYPAPYRPGPPPGFRCDARFGTPYGVRGLVCPLERPRPLGVRCHCVPPGPPGYPYGPPIRGRVIP